MSGHSAGRPYEAILFDFDGVLVDTEPVHFGCWQEALAPLNIHLEWEFYLNRCVGVADQSLLQLFHELAGPAIPFENVHATYERKRELFRQRVMADVPMPPATRSLFTRLEGYRLAVVSSSSRSEVEPPLERVGLHGYLDTIVCAEDVRRYKPSPEPYRLAAERLKVRRALVVEDSEAGQASGRAAGFDVLFVPHPQQTAALLAAHLGLGSI